MSIGHEEDYYGIYDEYTEERESSGGRESRTVSQERETASTVAKTTTVQPKTLSSPFIALFDAMLEASQGLPANLVAALKGLPPVGALPLPWVVRFLLSIFVHRQRQAWGRSTLELHMPEAVPPCDAFDDCGSPYDRRLPWFPEWEVSIGTDEPQRAILTNLNTGESIFVDISEEGNRAVLRLDTWIADRRCDSEIDPATGRLLELYPSPKGLVLPDNWRMLPQDCQVLVGDCHVVFELVDNGLVEGRKYGKPGPVADGTHADCFLPGDELIKHENLALDFLQHWKAPEKQLWCSALVGDWLLAHQLAIESNNQDLIRVTAPHAEECHRLRIRQVLGPYGEWGVDTEGYLILYYSLADDLDEHVQRGLEGNDSARDRVTRFLNLSGDSRWCELVYDRWSRGVQANEVLPDGLPIYLLRHGYRTDDVTDILSRTTAQPL